jgi:hypothetical protein
VIPFAGVVTSIPPGSTGQTLQLQLWDAAISGTNLFTETQTLDVDASGAISFVFGSATSGGAERDALCTLSRAARTRKATGTDGISRTAGAARTGQQRDRRGWLHRWISSIGLADSTLHYRSL